MRLHKEILFDFEFFLWHLGAHKEFFSQMIAQSKHINLFCEDDVRMFLLGKPITNWVSLLYWGETEFGGKFWVNVHEHWIENWGFENSLFREDHIATLKYYKKEK